MTARTKGKKIAKSVAECTYKRIVSEGRCPSLPFLLYVGSPAFFKLSLVSREDSGFACTLAVLLCQAFDETRAIAKLLLPFDGQMNRDVMVSLSLYRSTGGSLGVCVVCMVYQTTTDLGDFPDEDNGGREQPTI
ncbi:hypothetical protein B0H13DRAFT_1879063 [Mycena leptocephala]|nr:hypothetical protein B0H13DRAFT_1879063 [Mycena leptocephala]